MVTQTNEFIFRGQDLNLGSILLENINFATKSSVWGVFSLFFFSPKTNKNKRRRKRESLSVKPETVS